jgi:hypothetical protein
MMTEFPAYTGVFVPTAIKPPSSFYRAKRDLLGEAQIRHQLAQRDLPPVHLPGAERR